MEHRPQQLDKLRTEIILISQRAKWLSSRRNIISDLELP
jgi:hypothetical protein